MSKQLEHLFDPVFVLREANRVLKDEGMLIISVPNAANIYSRLNFTLTGELKDAAEISEIRSPEFLFSEHIRFFSAKKIRKTLQSTGFKILPTLFSTWFFIVCEKKHSKPLLL